jgi:hypothetical protein
MSFGNLFGEMSRRSEFEAKLPLPGLAFLDGAKIVRRHSTFCLQQVGNILHSMRHSVPQATHPGGAAQTLEDLRALDMVGIYVSAHWCCISFNSTFVF